MLKRIVIHLGLHKTATTSLQDFLLENTPALLRRGVGYIPLPRMRTDVTPLFWTVDKGRRLKLAEFLRAFGQDTLLLSDENLIGVPGELTQGGVYPYARNRVQTFCEEMADCRITLFLTLREPQWFITSMYSEYLRHNEFIPFEQFVAALDCEGFSYRKYFGWMGQLPANTRVRVMPFEAGLGGGVVGIAREIIEDACGPDSGVDPTRFPDRKSRSSYSTEELELAADLAAKASPLLSKFFLNMLDAREQRFGGTRFSPFPPGVSAKMLENYQADLRYFETLKT